MEKFRLAVELLAYVVAGAAVLARGIASRTSTKKDDEVAGWLEKLHNFFAFLGLQGTTLQDKRVVSQIKAANSAADKQP